jgi:Flp pilus assembly protein TadG
LGKTVSRLRARIRSFKGDAKGATALEFALVGLPFFFLLFTLIEVALIFVVSATLQSALMVATRTIRTGSFQGGATPTAATFVAQICGNMGWLQSSCTSQLQVDVRTETSFTSPTEPDPMATGTFNSSALTFNPGAAGQIVLVRAFYQWPLVVPGLDGALSQTNNGVHVIVQTTTFANEPYT